MKRALIILAVIAVLGLLTECSIDAKLNVTEQCQCEDHRIMRGEEQDPDTVRMQNMPEFKKERAEVTRQPG